MIGLAAVASNALLVGAALLRLARVGPERHPVGGWPAPLGIELTIDGWGLGFAAVTSLVALTVALYAARSWPAEPLQAPFWGLFLLLQAGLNALCLSGDLFNLYVTLEVVALSAAGLTALERDREAVAAALRYLLLSLVGSFSYLSAVVLVYREHGVLDLALLAGQGPDGPLTPAVVALMTAGLLLKTALFPLHTWLPRAHASAPAPVSALLSGLVVNSSFFVILRVSLATWPQAWDGAVAWILGALGAAAIFWGYTQALRSERLKAMVAYSTVAQTGQLFLVFPLAAAGARLAASAVLVLVASQALAKAAAFLAVGNVVRATGGDRLRDLERCTAAMPLPQATLAVASLSLVGLPPSAGFLGKWLVLEASFETGQWIWAAVLGVGTLLSAALMFRILEGTLSQRKEAETVLAKVPRLCEWGPFALAMLAAGLGLASVPMLELLGRVAGPASRWVGLR